MLVTFNIKNDNKTYHILCRLSPLLNSQDAIGAGGPLTPSVLQLFTESGMFGGHYGLP